ncbi:MFS transporter [Streptomyces clavifer]|uniref:MFS transporter n=1 Tax=Streptomyces clavifer TaxID=68188 RepID=UPI00369B77CD
MTTTATTAGRREWLGLTMIVLACLLVSMDMSVLFYAVPFLAADLGPSSGQLLWIMDSYGFLLAGLLMAMGALGDRIGRRRLLLAGAAAFGVASLCSAYANSPGMLIAARCLLGVAGATLAPSTLSLIRNMFHDEKERRSAIGIWTAGFALGAMIGPLTAGILLENFWWGSVFLINVPVMVLLVALGPFLLPEFRSPRTERFDHLGVVLSLAAVLPLVYGVKQLASGADGPALPLAFVALGLVFGYLFVRRQRSGSAPLVDLTLFRDPAFGSAVTVTAVLQFAMLGMTMLTSQYLQLALGIRPFAAAMWRLPAIATLILGLVLGGVLVRRIPVGRVIAVGLAVAAAGLGLMTLVTPGSGLALIVIGGSVVTVGCGIVVPLATDVVLAAAPPERAGAASGLSETSAEFGGALGIAILGTVTAAVYGRRVDGAVRDDWPASVGDRVHDTLAAALDAARELPAADAAVLRQRAIEAFTEGQQASFLVGAVILAAVSVTTALLLRRVSTRGRPAAEGEKESAVR